MLALFSARGQSTSPDGGSPLISDMPSNKPIETLPAPEPAETTSRPNLSESLKDMRSEIDAWSKDSDAALSWLEKVQAIASERESSLTELRDLYAKLASSTDAEAEACQAKIEVLEARIRQLQAELFLWRIVAVVGIAGVITFVVLWMVK